MVDLTALTGMEIVLPDHIDRVARRRHTPGIAVRRHRPFRVDEQSRVRSPLAECQRDNSRLPVLSAFASSRLLCSLPAPAALCKTRGMPGPTLEILRSAGSALTRAGLPYPPSIEVSFYPVKPDSASCRGASAPATHLPNGYSRINFRVSARPPASRLSTYMPIASLCCEPLAESCEL